MLRLLAVLLSFVSVLFILTGCGNGSAEPTLAEIAAANLAKASLIKGTWLISYILAGDVNPVNDTLTFSTVSPVNSQSHDFETNETRVSTNTQYHLTSGHYSSTNDLWTVSRTFYLFGSPSAVETHEYEFRINSSTILPGGCYYVISSGTRSACIPLSGVKEANGA